MTELKYSNVPRVNEFNLFEKTVRVASDVRADTSKEVRRLFWRVRLLRTGRFDAVTLVIQLLLALTVVNFGNPERANAERRFEWTFKEVRLGNDATVNDVRRLLDALTTSRAGRSLNERSAMRLF